VAVVVHGTVVGGVFPQQPAVRRVVRQHLQCVLVIDSRAVRMQVPWFEVEAQVIGRGVPGNQVAFDRRSDEEMMTPDDG